MTDKHKIAAAGATGLGRAMEKKQARAYPQHKTGSFWRPTEVYWPTWSAALLVTVWALHRLHLRMWTADVAHP